MQFSIRMMLAAVAAVGIGAALWTAKPSWQVGAVELSVSAWILVSAVILIAHSSGKAKVFWLGAGIDCILPLTVLMVSDVAAFSVPTAYKFDFFLLRFSGNFRYMLLLWAFAPLVGLLCVFTHWLLVRPPEPKA